ncbi:MAG: HNH endonuclease [Anaerolineae bacterium]|nr:HNH endonuclease [Anaerolineae bacterium]
MGKKVRFEVFKRDAFTCQYCGRSAPDVVLVIDHITPVAAGGSNDIMNLVTSCESCNAGKGARQLSDDAVVAKRKRQLDELQDRREQLEMMLEWQRELARLEEDTAASLAQIWANLVPGYGLNAAGQATLRKLVRRHGVPAVGEAMRIAAEHYLQYDAAGQPTQDSVELAWSKIGGICHLKEKDAEDPELKQLYYIRGILRNRLSYVNPWMAMKLLQQAREAGIELDELQDLACQVTSWTQFRETIEDWLP